jgi:hypothetical protein
MLTFYVLWVMGRTSHERLNIASYNLRGWVRRAARIADIVMWRRKREEEGPIYIQFKTIRQ